jgi:hypothetical protein
MSIKTKQYNPNICKCRSTLHPQLASVGLNRFDGKLLIAVTGTKI